MKWSPIKLLLLIAAFSMILNCSVATAGEDGDDGDDDDDGLIRAKIKLGFWQVSLQGDFFGDDEGTPGSKIKFDHKDFVDFDRFEGAVVPEVTLDVGPFRINATYWRFKFMADEIPNPQDFTFGGLDFPALLTKGLEGEMFLEELDVSLGFNLFESSDIIDLWGGAGIRMYGIGGKFRAVSLIPSIVPEFEATRTERMPVPVVEGQVEVHVSCVDFGIRGAWCNYRYDSMETDINLYDARGYVAVSSDHFGLEVGYHFLRLDFAFGQFDKDPIAFDGTLAGAYVFAVLKF